MLQDHCPASGPLLIWCTLPISVSWGPLLVRHGLVLSKHVQWFLGQVPLGHASEVFIQYSFTDLSLCPSRYSQNLENRTLWWCPKPTARDRPFPLTLKRPVQSRGASLCRGSQEA